MNSLHISTAARNEALAAGVTSIVVNPWDTREVAQKMRRLGPLIAMRRGRLALALITPEETIAQRRPALTRVWNEDYVHDNDTGKIHLQAEVTRLDSPNFMHLLALTSDQLECYGDYVIEIAMPDWKEDRVKDRMARGMVPAINNKADYDIRYGASFGLPTAALGAASILRQHAELGMVSLNTLKVTAAGALIGAAYDNLQVMMYESDMERVGASDLMPLCFGT